MATKATKKKKATTRKSPASSRSTGTKRKPEPDYRTMYEALMAQVADVHRMLDGASAPQNCGTINGRMIEFAKDWLKRCDPGHQTHPASTARKMLKAVDAPLWPL